MTFANPLPPWAIAAAVALAVLVAWAAYSRAPIARRRRGALSTLRAVTLLVLVLLLMRPVRSGGPDDAADAVVPILVDVSRSMGIEDVRQARRIDRAREILTGSLLPALSSRFRTDVLAFGEEARPAQPSALGATGRRSDLGGALAAVRDRYQGRPVAGIVILSDGGDTSHSGEEADLAGIPPVFAIPIGATAVERDREVLSVTAAEAVLDDSRVDLAVSAVSRGYGTAPIEIRLLENGRPLEVRRVAPSADGIPVSEIFKVAPAPGAATVYTIDVPADAREIVPENNRRSVLVQPPARPRRVLLVQGAPGFEGTFLRRAWNGDPGLEVDSVVRKGKNEQGNDTFYIQASAARTASLATGFPVETKDLFAYDAIVLANVEGASLTSAQLETTREFVGRRGGGLLVLGAQSFTRRGFIDTPLEELLPLDAADRGRGVLPAAAQAPRAANRVALTPAGETHPIMQLTAAHDETRKRWDAVPALAAIAALGGPRPGATVLAVTSGAGGAPRALVAVQRYGEGRSMIFTGEAAWRWRMMLPANDRSYDTFWRQAVRWLALPATDPVTIVAPAGAAAGDAVALRIAARDAAFATLRDPDVKVRVTRPDGRVESIPAVLDTGAGGNATFVARLRADDAGVYRTTAEVQAGGAEPITTSTSLLVGGADPEMADPRVNLRVLQRLAAATGGRIIEPSETGALTQALQSAVPAAVGRIRTDLWHNGWSFLAIVFLMAGEWLLRRRWGLR